jgi:spore photoproduct lyase
MPDVDYAEKFRSFAGRTLFESLDDGDRKIVRRLAFEHRLTFQEFRQVAEAARDLEVWGEGGIARWWESQPPGASHKRNVLGRLREHLETLRHSPRAYATSRPARPEHRAKPVVTESSDKKVWGMCPVASERTVCCNLRTIDAVENCVFGCTYCSVQTFYHDSVVFHEDFAEKLRAIPVEPGRFYHFGTGQSSDALAWGNKHGVLDDLCAFARAHPDVLLEFKTKSDNVRYFLEHDIPENVVCSWSLNPQTVVDHEEHFTASTERRLAAARSVADRGVGVAFHFHPMVYYDAWESDYPALAERLVATFSPDEVIFVSFGSVTLIKPVLRKIRELGNPSRIHQMDLAPDPHGKLTCSDELKVRMFSRMWSAFTPWHGRVFTYLCMEKADIWRRSFGRVYPDNTSFEADFGRHTMAKLRAR